MTLGPRARKLYPRTLASPPAKNRCDTGNKSKSPTSLAARSARSRVRHVLTLWVYLARPYTCLKVTSDPRESADPDTRPSKLQPYRGYGPSSELVRDRVNEGITSFDVRRSPPTS